VTSLTPARRGHRALWLGIVVASGIVLVVFSSLALGSNHLGLAAVIDRLLHPANDTGAIVWGSRVPRTLLGALVGACLGIAGAVMQGQTRNPLADPGLFGVSAGASLAVVIGVYTLHTTSTTIVLLLALFGAIAASVIVFSVAALGRGLSSPVPLAIAGTAVSALFAAVTSFLVLSDQTTLAAYRVWVVGSLSGRRLDNLGTVLVFVVLGLILAFANTRSLDSLALGTEVARGLGENLVRSRLIGLGAITLLTAASVAVTGPIGFIGLTAPHIARRIVGGRHARLLPMSAVVGAFVLLASDVIGRLLGGLAEVSVGVVLSVIGGIAFVAIVRHGRMAAL
jgi:iron complex transport system permease protein